MARNTKIEWTNHTWNPWHGCRKVSAGCANCYMFREKKRFGQDPEKVVRSAPKTFNAPLNWIAPARVFVCSWSDFFISDADQWRAEAWEIIEKTRHLTFQILTKRPEDMLTRLPMNLPELKNVWLGVTVENRREALRLQHLRMINAAVNFVSIEPLLEDLGDIDLTGIDWVICGGETGPGARVMETEWALSLKEQCIESGIPFFFKQMTKKDTIPIELMCRDFPVCHQR